MFKHFCIIFCVCFCFDYQISIRKCYNLLLLLLFWFAFQTLRLNYCSNNIANRNETEIEQIWRAKSTVCVCVCRHSHNVLRIVCWFKRNTWFASIFGLGKNCLKFIWLFFFSNWGEGAVERSEEKEGTERRGGGRGSIEIGFRALNISFLCLCAK